MVATKFEPDMEVVMKLEKESKGAKAPKDENAPKRPLTAFLAWSMATRPEVVETYPDLKLGEIGRKLGELWKAADPETKNKYQSKYEEERKKFDKKMEKYKKTEDWRNHQNALLAWKIRHTKKPFPSDKNAPKRALNGYMCFINENRETFRDENPNMAITEVTKHLTKRWNEIGEEGQKVYKDMSQKQKIQYKKKFDSYTKTDDYKTYADEKEAYLTKMRTKRNKLMGIKKKKKTKGKPAKSASPSRSRSRGRRERRKSSKKSKNKKSKNRKRRRSSSRSSSRSVSREAKKMKKRSRHKKSRSKGRERRKSSKKHKAAKRKAKKSGKRKAKKSKRAPPPEDDDSQTEMDATESSD